MSRVSGGEESDTVAQEKKKAYPREEDVERGERGSLFGSVAAGRVAGGKPWLRIQGLVMSECRIIILNHENHHTSSAANASHKLCIVVAHGLSKLSMAKS